MYEFRSVVDWSVASKLAADRKTELRERPVSVEMVRQENQDTTIEQRTRNGGKRVANPEVTNTEMLINHKEQNPKVEEDEESKKSMNTVRPGPRVMQISQDTPLPVSQLRRRIVR
ncbi:hypothetical protein PF003_g9300 [Phytophthora fragariae]|nr:hypothetical protein PF003_g9300 [Phytophthora fragariae]